VLTWYAKALHVLYRLDIISCYLLCKIWGGLHRPS
jgi:hypothetical protein